MDPQTLSAWLTFAGIIVSGVFGVVTAVITTNARIKKEREQNRLDEALREQRQEIKFNEIDDKLREHNGYAEKFATFGEAIVGFGRDLTWIKEEVKELKELHRGKK